MAMKKQCTLGIHASVAPVPPVSKNKKELVKSMRQLKWLREVNEALAQGLPLPPVVDDVPLKFYPEVIEVIEVEGDEIKRNHMANLALLP